MRNIIINFSTCDAVFHNDTDIQFHIIETNLTYSNDQNIKYYIIF